MSNLHILLTNWNACTSYSQDKNGNPIDDAWTEHRMSLFFRYTMPSVYSQLFNNFVWVLFFREGFLDTKYGKEIIRAIPTDKWPRTICTTQNHLTVCNRLVEEYKPEVLVTSRLDNDDMLHPNFMYDIARIVWPMESFWNPVSGFKAYTSSDNVIRLERVRQERNPFCSYAESTDKTIKTVWHKKHSDIGPVTDYDNHSWIQIIHERNVCNK